MKPVLLLLFITMNFFQFSDKRKVLLFSTDKNNSLLTQQQKILYKDPQGMQERDIVTETYILDEKNRNIFKKYKALDQPFLFILIGKDGGEKLRSSTPVDNQKLFGLIDQMPMRQGEMRRQ